MAGDGYGGYIALEQAYLNYTADSWDARAGVVLAPVGIINETHEPPTFLSVERPDYMQNISFQQHGLVMVYNSITTMVTSDLVSHDWKTLIGGSLC